MGILSSAAGGGGGTTTVHGGGRRILAGGAGGNRGKDGEGQDGGVCLDLGVVIETGAVVEARYVGEGSVVEVGARVGRGSVIGKVGFFSFFFWAIFEGWEMSGVEIVRSKLGQLMSPLFLSTSSIFVWWSSNLYSTFPPSLQPHFAVLEQVLYIVHHFKHNKYTDLFF